MEPLWRVEVKVSLNLSIKSVPEALAERLRQRAERNHRSLQGELMAIIERAAAEESGVAAAAAASGVVAAAAGIAHAAPLGAALRSVRRGSKAIEQLMAERNLRPLQASPGLPRAVDIVRETRDSRGSN